MYFSWSDFSIFASLASGLSQQQPSDYKHQELFFKERNNEIISVHFHERSKLRKMWVTSGAFVLMTLP